MTQQAGNTGGNTGNSYGNPQAQPPGFPPPPQGYAAAPAPAPGQHPYASPYGYAPGYPPPAHPYPQNAGRGANPLLVVGLIVLVVVCAGVAFVALGGPSMLTPKTARASAMARNPRAVANATSQAQTLRSQLALYALQHQDRMPTLAQLQANWGVLLNRTANDGSLAPQGAGNTPGSRSAYPFGPYLQVAPVNPLTGSSKVVAAGKATTEAGWTYDEATGKIWAVSPADTEEVQLSNGAFEVVK
jgi:hypothetical protein